MFGMPSKGNEGSDESMDLNLYLGLPYSPVHHPRSNSGSALAIHSVHSPSEETPRSSEMPPADDVSDAPDPYSSADASFPPMEENIQLQYSRPSFLPPLRALEESRLRLRALGSRPLYAPYSPSFNHVSTGEGTAFEPLGERTTDHSLHHFTYSPSYRYVSALGQIFPQSIEDGSNLNHRGCCMSLRQERHSPGYTPIMQALGSDQNDVSPVQADEGTYSSYMPSEHPLAPPQPSYVPAVSPQLVHGDRTDGPVSASNVFIPPYERPVHMSEPVVRDVRSYHEVLHYPEFRLRRILETSRRWSSRRFRSRVPYITNPITASLLSPTQISQQLTESEPPPVATTRLQKLNVQVPDTGDVDGESVNQENPAANFECNICLDMARDPVVTSCGHLFCWYCLYQWLHMHCVHKECPVCKGEVTESNLVPIYGRGNSEGRSSGPDRFSSLKIPPRPHGCRIESLRQRIHSSASRGILGGDISSWRRFVDEEIRNGSRADASDGQNLPGILGPRNVLTRLRALQRLRGGDNLVQRSNVGGGEVSVPRNTPESTFQNENGQRDGPEGLQAHGSPVGDAFDFWRLSLYTLHTSDRIAALTAGLSNMMERMVSGGSHSGGSSSVNHLEPEARQEQEFQGASVTADQVSASSTIAVIQGDVGVGSASVEPSGAETSRSPRRRRRNGPSGSLDLEGVHPARKRRRLG